MFRSLFPHTITAFRKESASATLRIRATHSRTSTSPLTNFSRPKNQTAADAAAIRTTRIPTIESKNAVLRQNKSLPKGRLIFYILISKFCVNSAQNHTLSSFAKFDISFLVPALSNAISSKTSLPIGLAESIIPVPKALWRTVSPTSKRAEFPDFS